MEENSLRRLSAVVSTDTDYGSAARVGVPAFSRPPIASAIHKRPLGRDMANNSAAEPNSPDAENQVRAIIMGLEMAEKLRKRVRSLPPENLLPRFSDPGPNLPELPSKPDDTAIVKH